MKQTEENKPCRLIRFFSGLKNFFLGMISANNESSHKRFIALGSFLILVVLALTNQWWALDVKDTFIYVFAGLAGLQSTLSMFEKHDNNQNNGNGGTTV